MHEHVINFYTSRPDRQVVALHEGKEGSLATWLDKAPSLPKGWWELALLAPLDRLEFVETFWTMKLPYSPQIQELIEDFFTELEEIGIYLVKQQGQIHFTPELVYIRKDSPYFYRGAPPAHSESLSMIYPLLGQRLSEEYVSFLKIHNGFAQGGERGMLSVEKMGEETYRMQTELMSGLYRMTFENEPLNPRHLIAFYAREEKRFYQCFHTQWYPDGHMGTLGLSLSAREQGCILMDATRPSFVCWLQSYLGSGHV